MASLVTAVVHDVPLRDGELDAMREALSEARAAGQAGEVPVGAVLVLAGAVRLKARNGMRASGDPTAHAETIVLREGALLLGVATLREATLVVSMEPCAMCAGAIVLARVRRVVFGAWDDRAGMCGSVGDIVRHPQLNHRPEVQGGVLAAESAKLLREFFAERR